VANARVTFTGADDNWDVSTFVNNLTDEEVPIMAYDTVGSSGYNLRAYGPPRWYGVRVGLRF
jgi:iron complex outermembrane receptor protein